MLPHSNFDSFFERHASLSDLDASESATAEESAIFTPESESDPFLADYVYGSPAINSTQVDEVNPGQPLEGGRTISHLSPQTTPQYNSRRSYSSQMHTNPMPQSAYPPDGHHGVQNTSQPSQYAPYSGAFPDSESARQYRVKATGYGRVPYRPPDGDPSIQELIQTRQLQVQRIYNAMVRPDAAKDNPGSIAMRRWAHDAFYPHLTVESYAHKVFDCLIKQVTEGYRGWAHNDYASDERKGEPEDKNVSCAGRLENIICALEEEKTICEDVMASACQIRMFVNAPRAYARRKEANRHGNSKRGKATPSRNDAGARARSRRLSARSRQSQAAPCPLPDSQQTPNQHTHQLPLLELEPNPHSHGPQAPYYHTADSQFAHQNPVFARPESAPAAAFPHTGFHSSTLSPPLPPANGVGVKCPPDSSSLPIGGHANAFLSPTPGAQSSLPGTPATHVTHAVQTRQMDTTNLETPCGNVWSPPRTVFPMDNQHIGNYSGSHAHASGHMMNDFSPSNTLFQHHQQQQQQSITEDFNVDHIFNMDFTSPTPQQAGPGTFSSLGEALPSHGLPLPAGGVDAPIDPSLLSTDFQCFWNAQSDLQTVPATTPAAAPAGQTGAGGEQKSV